MSDLIFIGGAKGVGKSTIVDLLTSKYNILSINTGNIYSGAKRKGVSAENEIVDFLNSGFKGVVDTHFAGYDGAKGFVRGLSKDSLLRIKPSIDFILVDLSQELLYERRIRDLYNERIMHKEHMAAELESNRYFFKEYCVDTGKNGLILLNYDSNKSVQKIAKLIEHEK